MDPQNIPRIFGVLFLITVITSIPAYFFYVPVLDDPRYIVGAGANTRVSLGAFLELVLIIAIGTAVVLYPIVRRQNENRTWRSHASCAVLTCPGMLLVLRGRTR